MATAASGREPSLGTRKPADLTAAASLMRVAITPPLLTRGLGEPSLDIAIS
jgi:hypothetical protein